MPISKVSEAGLSSGAQFNTFKNRIINGKMDIDQRNAGASLNPADFAYSVDRWKCRRSQSSKFTVQQNAGSVTPPAGFSNYLGVTSSSAYSVLTADYFAIQQLIEGLNFADLAWGTASAQTVTLSFWVRSSLTGTFGGALNNGAEVRAYGFTYTINAANTWEQKTITIPGDTTGTWLTTNGIGLYVNFNLGTGSTYGSATNGSWTNDNTQFTPSGATSVVGTNGATFYITGVQLEKGSTATSFDYRPFGTELALCQRYYESLYNSNGTMNSNGNFIALGVCENASRAQPYYIFKVQKRSAPSTTLSAIGTFGLRSTGGASTICTSGSFGSASTTYVTGEFNIGSSAVTSGGAAWLVNHDGNAKIEWSSEL